MRTADREQLVLAALAPARCASFNPVHVQKLFFLIDEQLSDEIGGRAFDFEPYDYGPYDKTVYTVLESLAEQGLVTITQRARTSDRRYNLTTAGQAEGQAALNAMGPGLAGKITTLSNWVRSLSFAQLVSAVYAAYPAMKVNSVFSE